MERLSANRGDLFEAFFAAAVASRFVRRVKENCKSKLPPVTATHVNGVLRKMMSSGYSKRVPDCNSTVMDTVTVSVAIPQKAMDFLMVESNWNKVTDLRQGAISFANSHSRLNAQARGLSINERADIISVSAQGTTNQSGIKADVQVNISSQDLGVRKSGKPRMHKNINYSLKVSGGEQFHQVAGLGFDKFVNIFQEGFGINIENGIQKTYENEVEKFFGSTAYTKRYTSEAKYKASGDQDKLKECAMKVYQYVYKQFKKIMEKNGETDEKTKVADYIIYGLSRNVNTELVKFNTKTGSIKNRIADRKFRDILVGNTYKVNMGGTATPTIKFSIGSKLIFQIRYKTEKGKRKDETTKQEVYTVYPRHYMEAGEGLLSLGL